MRIAQYVTIDSFCKQFFGADRNRVASRARRAKKTLDVSIVVMRRERIPAEGMHAAHLPIAIAAEHIRKLAGITIMSS